MRALLSLSLGAALALAYSPLAAGQAIIGYGINVGRAGAAGAATGATGAGAAGIFKRLNDTLTAEPENKPSQAATTERKPEFDKDAEPRAAAAAGQAKSVFKSSGEVVTKSGVKISGLVPVTGPRRWVEPEPAAQAWVPMPAAPAVSAPPPAPSRPSTAAVGAPPAADTEAANDTEATAAPATGGEGSTAAERTQQVGSRSSILQARRATAYPNRPHVAIPATAQTGAASEPIGASKPAGHPAAEIFEGEPITLVIERFGKPLMRMVGIPRDGYSEKYLFRAPDGSRFAVLTQNGKVVRVLADRPMPSRASR